MEYQINEQLLSNVFKEIMPKHGYRIRENQIALAQTILKALQTDKIALCEAEVGTGKTHAYIIASIVHKLIEENSIWKKDNAKKPILISTSSIALQKAIMNNYLPEISAILMENRLIHSPLTAVIRKGKDHYICDKRLMDCINGMATKADQKEYKPLEKLNYLRFTQIDLDELPQLSSYVKKKISVPQNCGSFCHQYDKCRFNTLMKFMKSDKHNFQICNHNYCATC